MRSFFQFAYAKSDGSTKFFLVETVTVEQAECVMEAVKSGLDPKCILLASFTNCSAANTFNGVFSTVEFAEFMTDLAGFGELPERLQTRIEAAAEPAAPVSVRAIPGPDQSELLISALAGMGFSKGVVSRWVKSIGDRASRAPLTDLVRDGVRALVSASAS